MTHLHTDIRLSLPPSQLSSSLPGFPPSLPPSLLQSLSCKLSRLSLNVLILPSTQEQECNQINTQPGSPSFDAGDLSVRNSAFPVKRESVTSSAGFVTSVVSAQEQIREEDKGATQADV